MKKPKTLNPTFAALAAAARQSLGISQPELARLAGVSPKTIVQIERDGIARWDAVARVAHALSQPVDQWLKLAGHDVSALRVEDLLRKRPAPMIPPFPRLDPSDYYRRVAERLKLHGSALMCTCILSHVPLANPALNKQIEMVLGSGLHFALLCPFPLVDQEFASRRPRLTQYYGNTYTWACNLADRLRRMVPAAQNRIHVFTPAIPAGGTPLVYTPIRANELRPSFTKYSETNKVQVKYEFGALLRYPDPRPDQWVDIYSGDGDMSTRVQEAYEPWYDYCFDIFDAWSPENGESTYDLNKLGGWRMTPR